MRLSLPETKNGMVKILGGTSMQGSTGVFETPFGKRDFPEERPTREVEVTGFWIDQTEVTNEEFEEFITATAYVTFAERDAKKENFPAEAHTSLPPFPFKQGSIVFTPTEIPPIDINIPGSELSWWRWDPEANWRQPLGKGSNIIGKADHPVVCITHEDATAYAKWAGKRLPTESEWEYAARGGLKNQTYTWGDELKINDNWMANTFHGQFPSKNTADDGFIGIAPTQSYSANGYGLYDMAGNVWEICSDFYDPKYPSKCEKFDTKGPTQKANITATSHVIKGGSFLCHVSYCMRYRPAARHSMLADSPTNHIGFRCVSDL